jgi:Spy/CpxP family protein refolding chaperone
MSKRLLVMIGALALIGAGVALAWPEREAAGPGPDIARIQKEVGLNDGQVDQLKKLWTGQRKQEIRQRADMAIARMDLHQLLDAPTVDEKAVNAKVKELSDLHATALRAHVDSMLGMHKILTPEQRQKMKALMRSHRPAFRGMRRGFGHGGSGGPDRQPRGPERPSGGPGPGDDLDEGDEG